MKTIGIKLADGSFYPILEEGTEKTYQLDLTTVKDGQTKVQIDLYRSETGTMEDAEYVDTLEVTNLVPHPNGEVELHLSVGLNENNELDAKVVDEETGKQSETNVTLVSRTLAERSEPTNFELTDNEDFSLPQDEDSVSEEEIQDNSNNGAVAAAALGGAAAGAAAAYALTKEDETGNVKTETVDEVPFSFDSEISEDQKDDGFGENAIVEDLNETSFDDETNTVDVDNLAGEEVSDDFDADSIIDSVEEGSVNDDFGIISDDSNTEAVKENTEEPFSFDSELPDFDETITDETVADTDNLADISTESEKTQEIEGSTDDMFDNDSFTNDPVDADAQDNIAEKDNTFADTALPDFDETDFGSSEETTSVSDEDFNNTTQTATADDDFTLPDFDAPSVSDFGTTENADTTEASGLSGYFNDPDLNNDPVFNETNLDTDDSEINFDTSDLDSNNGSGESNGISSGPAMDFSDLYDKETLNGESSSYNDEDEEENKTKVPMIICIICAIICVIATVLVLFIVPSKYNLLHKTSSKDSSVEQVFEAPVEETPEIETVEAPAAVEDKIVVAPESEVVVPVVPPAPEPEKAKDVKYRIRWGDTLWDIADAYYKNPWRYPKIAKYNKIKNPDLIISGTDILIPVE